MFTDYIDSMLTFSALFSTIFLLGYFVSNIFIFLDRL